jgi:hypothetical protein
VAELVAGSLDRSRSERVDVRILSTNTTATIQSEHATPLPARTPPGELVLLYRCVREGFLRRTLLPLLKHDELLELVLSFLRIKQVAIESVRAVGASSSAEHSSCGPQNTLTPDDQRWWISAPSSCPNGVGSEWVLYELCSEEQGLARVSYIQLKIPKLPFGPLSVRHFRLEAANEKTGPFVRASPDLTTMNTKRLQQWALVPPIEARYVRVVCTMNAIADAWDTSRESLGGMHLSLCDAIGFFHVRFS